MTLADVREAFRRSFGPEYDLDALSCALAVAAAERLDGDPPWLLIVGGPGAAKTETIITLAGVPRAHLVSTISGEAALLSGTPRKERNRKATGGLLRALGEHGLLIVKDVTSILSMNRDTRASVLAALREVYDGSWSRNVGTEGGQTLTWKGRVVVIGAVTTAWDAAHSVIATMGDRFLLVRLDSAESPGRRAAGRQAMRNVSREVRMRKELSAIVAALIESAARRVDDLTEAEEDELLAVADLVSVARSTVDRDYSGDPVFAHAPEMPTRLAKQLVQVVRGAMALGADRPEALRLARRCAHDSMPPIRLRVLLDVSAHPRVPVADVARRLQLPRKTIERVLRELQMQRLLVAGEQPYGTLRATTVYTLAETETVEALESLR